jgi:hypothetical protein
MHERRDSLQIYEFWKFLPQKAAAAALLPRRHYKILFRVFTAAAPSVTTLGNFRLENSRIRKQKKRSSCLVIGCAQV